MISYLLKQDWFKQKKHTNLLINLNDNNLYNQYILMFKHIENLLKNDCIIRSKKIAFHPNIDGQTQNELTQLKETAKNKEDIEPTGKFKKD